MNEPGLAKSVERLFPFALRSRILLIGRDTLRRSKRKLHFVLITRDVSDNSRAEVLADFAHYPVVQHYTAADLEKFFGIKGAKVIGFGKSPLAQSIYAELKEHRINKPASGSDSKPAKPMEKLAESKDESGLLPSPAAGNTSRD
ncbi:MAG TPA: hypothetical protein VI454_02015 [Verrucomicrobiae bacterium]|jgi:hypothetical protein